MELLLFVKYQVSRCQNYYVTITITNYHARFFHGVLNLNNGLERFLLQG